MTTCAITHRNHHNGPIFLIVFVIAALVVVAPVIVQAAHAITHPEGAEISKCAENPGNWIQVWLNSSGQRYNCLVELSDGRIGNAVRQFSCRRDVWIEINNYIIGGGTLEETIGVLLAKGCDRIK